MNAWTIGLNDNLIEIDLNVSKCIMDSFACLSTMYYNYQLVEPNKMLLKHQKQNLMRSNGSQIKN